MATPEDKEHNNKKQKRSHKSSMTDEELLAYEELERAEKKVKKIEDRKKKEREQQFKEVVEKLAHDLGGKLIKAVRPYIGSLSYGRGGIRFDARTIDVFISIDLGEDCLAFVENSGSCDWYLHPKDAPDCFENERAYSISGRGTHLLRTAWMNQQKIGEEKSKILSIFSRRVLGYHVNIVQREQEWRYYV